MKYIQEYIKHAPMMSDYDRKFYAPKVVEYDQHYPKPPIFRIWRFHPAKCCNLPGSFRTRESAERKLTSITEGI